jgi:hypothetical protein
LELIVVRDVMYFTCIGGLVPLNPTTTPGGSKMSSVCIYLLRGHTDPVHTLPVNTSALCNHVAAVRASAALHGILPTCGLEHTRVYPKVSGLAARSEDCKWYSSVPLGAVISLFYESV